MKLKHVDLAVGNDYRMPAKLKPSSARLLLLSFFPIGEEIQQIVADWVTYLRQIKLWGDNDPLFPATEVPVGEECRFRLVGLDRKHCSNTTPIRTIFREAFDAAGLPYFNPHSLRNTLVQLGKNVVGHRKSSKPGVRILATRKF